MSASQILPARAYADEPRLVGQFRLFYTECVALRRVVTRPTQDIDAALAGGSRLADNTAGGDSASLDAGENPVVVPDFETLRPADVRQRLVAVIEQFRMHPGLTSRSEDDDVSREARYVMDRITGDLRTTSGPAMLLPDPRKKVIVRRVLSDTQVTLWYPGNEAALEYNRHLRQLLSNVPTTRSGAISEGDYERGTRRSKKKGVPKGAGMERAITGEQDLVADEFTRASTYTQPRTVTLETKFQGGPSVDVWTGYAVMIISKTGKRRVEQGPTTVLLEYDESLEVLELSTGKPKTTDALIRVAETLLDKPGGYLTNDVMPPSVFLDNIPNWEYGVLQQVRDLARVIRNDHSRSQSQSRENADIAAAEPRFFFDRDSWILPPTESEYRDAIAGFKTYRDELADDEFLDSDADARADCVGARVAGSPLAEVEGTSGVWNRCSTEAGVLSPATAVCQSI